MRKQIRRALLLSAVLAVAAVSARAQDIAAAPPMGWNSWDAYGLTIDEADFKANAAVLAGLKQDGWTTAVIDEGWYMENPFGDTLKARDYQLDAHGLLIPVADRYPSSAGGAGFKPLADWLHAQGLKFGIHIVRGIPKQAVQENTPIAGSDFHAADAADTSDTCPWDDGNYGVRDDAAGQAYYDSMVALYASWGVDFLKVDCIADHPYKESEIRQIAAAIKKSGRPIVLSLSPGPSQISHAIEYRRYSQMWRISNDIWDKWDFKNHTPDGFPSGVVTAFGHLALWSGWSGRGHWPDADMLPFGSLTPHPGWGEPRLSRLTPEEERTQFTLWAVSRSPLILGANLTKLDAFTKSLITNKAVIAVNQTSWDSHPVTGLPAGFDNIRVWTASAGPHAKPVRTVALFNLGDKPAALKVDWNELGFPGEHASTDLWTGTTHAASAELDVTLPAHGSAIYRLD
ncbi:MAG: glycoside hydrolase family 27 protein [Alphaproteobacteria bacterium]|nr:glycoside hydrolase family 27 protein [Alphaproteobacteria bacterium]